MKRSPIALLPWMVLATAAYGQTRSADVLYTHYDDVPTHALRVGDEAFVALDDVTRWGWKTTAWADMVDVKAEDKKVSVPFRVFNGRQMLPLRAAVKKLGAESEWVGNTDTLWVFGKLTSVSVKEGKLHIESGIGFRPRSSTLSNPSRLVVDLEGVRLDPKTVLDLDPTSRLVQYKPNVARLIIETSAIVDLNKLNGGETSDLEFEFAPPKKSLPEEPSQEGAPTTDTKAVDPPTPPPIRQAGVLDVQVESESGGELKLRFTTLPNGDPVLRKPSPTTLEVVLPGVSLSLKPGLKVDSPSITSISLRTAPEGTIVTLGLARAMGAEIYNSAEGVFLQMLKPNVGDGKLAGKLIVVDPGHGGHDNGANAGGVYEKNLNLTIGKLIASELAKAGATVIMTRKTDVFIPLNTRAQIAEQNHADLFISSHINSTGGSGSQSGGITFHHFGRPVSRILAECIQSEIAKVGGIPNIGVWSDGKIYRSGFSVLRQTTMPGVLLELGFINHPRDRKRLVTEEFQRGVAAAVVRGIKVFLGDAKKND